jgi:anti-sigma B factor antagonist
VDFAIQTVRAGPSTTLVVSGEVDLANAHEVAQAGLAALADGTLTVTVDMRDVTFLDSTGLAALVTINNQAQQDGATVVLSHAPPRIVHLLAVTGLDKIFTIADSTQ